MSNYDPHVLCHSAAQILLLSAPDTKTKTAMECAGFKSVDEEYKLYRKRIERMRNRLRSSHPSQITIQEELTESTSSMSNSIETVSAQVRTIVPWFIVVFALLTYNSCCLDDKSNRDSKL